MKDLSSFQSLPLWQEMEKKINAEELSLVERHMNYILPQLEKYVDTFQTYTLHNSEHIYNVVKIMGELLGDKPSTVSGLEAVVMILSAAYHDFGMVYSEEERQKIGGYENFNKVFLVEQ